MTADGFQVDADALTYHANRLGTVRDAVSLAADAARQVDLHDGAFGLLCAFLPPLVDGAEVATGDAITAVTETVEAMAAGVVEMARDYAAVDDAVSSRLHAVGDSLR